MKITVINGQNHKGTTYFGEFCCGCNNCFGKSEMLCPHYEKLRPITEAIDRADVLIFTSPVYVYHCTGAMKSFLDHYGWRWMVHRPEEKNVFKTGGDTFNCRRRRYEIR